MNLSNFSVQNSTSQDYDDSGALRLSSEDNFSTRSGPSRTSSYDERASQEKIELRTKSGGGISSYAGEQASAAQSAGATADAGAWSTQTEGVAVHTGFPNPGIDARLHGLDLNSLLIKNSASTYMMRIAGNDWRHVGIFDGDVAVVDRALSAQTNDVIIWWHDGDFAISARNRMQPGGTIWGVVTSVIHQYRYKVEQGEAN